MISSTPVNSIRYNISYLILLLGILTTFAPFSTDMYLAAFPAMANDLSTDIPHIQQSLSVFFLGLSIGQLVYGPLSDRYGRRKLLLVGIIIFIFSSALLIFIRNIQFFLVLRFIQAVGGCAGMIISRAIISDLFDLKTSAKVLTIMMAIQTIGPVAAPIFGGYILSWTSWTSIFILLTLLGVGCFIITLISLPESLAPEKRLIKTPKEIILGFVSLLRNRNFILPTLAGGLGIAASFAFLCESPFIFMNLYGLDETQYGWILGFFCIGTTLFSQTNIFFLKRYTAYQVLAGALIVMVISAITLSLYLINSNNARFELIIGGLFLALLTCPIICANSVAIAMSSSNGQTGTASSLIGTIQFIFASMISFLISVLHNGSALPTASLIGFCGVSALTVLAVRYFKRER